MAPKRADMMVAMPKRINPHPAGILGDGLIINMMIMVAIAPARTIIFTTRRKPLEIAATWPFSDFPPMAESSLFLFLGSYQKLSDVPMSIDVMLSLQMCLNLLSKAGI